jgi:hypothetical protein
MMRNLIVLLLFLGINYTLLAQTEKKISTELELVIYKGNAYKKWYRFNVNSGRKIRELKEKIKEEKSSFNKGVNEAALEIIQKKIDKANKKEAKAKVFHAVNFPVSFVLHKNENPELPWTAATIELKNDGIYEDDFLKIKITKIETSNSTAQNIFNYIIQITNKHVRFLNLKNEWVQDVSELYFSFIIDYEDGHFDGLNPHFSGTVYQAQKPKIYKTNNKTYSFIPFLDRYGEAVREKVTEAF